MKRNPNRSALAARPPLKKRKPRKDRFQSWKKKSYSADVVELLGKVSDSVVARFLGITRQAVALERQRRRIPARNPPRQRVEWSAEMIRALGTAADKALGARFGCSTSVVGQKRRQFGIRHHIPVDRIGSKRRIWRKKEIARLGKGPDSVIGLELGINSRWISAERKRRGIRRFGTLPQPWSARDIAMLGTAPDEVVAMRLRRGRPAVSTKRHILGIPNAGKQIHRWTPNEIALLGRVSDAVVAKKVGVSVVAVATARKSRKIPSPKGK